MPEKSKKALVTGSSRGIGEEMARILASKGYELVLVGRDSDRLKKISYELKCDYFVCDLGNRNEVEGLIEANPEIDVLINNAGFSSYGSFQKLSWDIQSKMIDVNVFALTRLCYYYLTKMLTKNSGNILNVASTAALCPSPYMSTYVGTKAFVTQFSKSLSLEVVGTGVTVSCMLPGPTKTSFWEYSNLSSKVSKSFSGYDDPYKVAEFGIKLLEKGCISGIPGFKNKLKTLIKYLLPEGLLLYLSRKHMLHDSLDNDL